MQAKHVRGTVWKVPVKGTYVDIDQADSTALVRAASGAAHSIGEGLAKGGTAIGKGLLVGGALVGAGLLGLGVALVLVKVLSRSAPKHRRGSTFDTLVEVTGESHTFFGVLLDDCITFVSGRQVLQVPAQNIVGLQVSPKEPADTGDLLAGLLMLWAVLTVVLIPVVLLTALLSSVEKKEKRTMVLETLDGSRYTGFPKGTARFLTAAGLIEVPLDADTLTSILGVTPTDTKARRRRLRRTLRANAGVEDIKRRLLPHFKEIAEQGCLR
jgi:hypothetical protein